jgi:hypothetical protein
MHHGFEATACPWCRHAAAMPVQHAHAAAMQQPCPCWLLLAAIAGCSMLLAAAAGCCWLLLLLLRRLVESLKIFLKFLKKIEKKCRKFLATRFLES